MCFYAFGQCFRLFLDMALQKPPTRLFLLLFLFRQVIEKLCILFGYIALSQPLLLITC